MAAVEDTQQCTVDRRHAPGGRNTGQQETDNGYDTQRTCTQPSFNALLTMIEAAFKQELPT